MRKEESKEGKRAFKKCTSDYNEKKFEEEKTNSFIFLKSMKTNSKENFLLSNKQQEAKEVEIKKY